MTVKALLAGSLLCLSLAPSAHAILNVPVPSNAYITIGGFDWAWASPLPGADLSFQGTLGWRIPTAAELLSAPLATDFLFPGANVPFNGTDPISGATFQATNTAYANAASAGAVATPYFHNDFLHVDWQDGNGQPFGPWAGSPGALTFADQLVIRNTISTAAPEPATLSLLAIGGLGVLARRRRK